MQHSYIWLYNVLHMHGWEYFLHNLHITCCRVDDMKSWMIIQAIWYVLCSHKYAITSKKAQNRKYRFYDTTQKQYLTQNIHHTKKTMQTNYYNIFYKLHLQCHQIITSTRLPKNQLTLVAPKLLVFRHSTNLLSVCACVCVCFYDFSVCLSLKSPIVSRVFKSQKK